MSRTLLIVFDAVFFVVAVNVSSAAIQCCPHRMSLFAIVLLQAQHSYNYRLTNLKKDLLKQELHTESLLRAAGKM